MSLPARIYMPRVYIYIYVCINILYLYTYTSCILRWQFILCIFSAVCFLMPSRMPSRYSEGRTPGRRGGRTSSSGSNTGGGGKSGASAGAGGGGAVGDYTGDCGSSASTVEEVTSRLEETTVHDVLQEVVDTCNQLLLAEKTDSPNSA